MFRAFRVFVPLVAVVLLKASGPDFEKNSGQADPQYLFLARAAGARAYVEDSAIEFRGPSAGRVRFAWANADRTGTHGSSWAASEPTGNFYHYCNQPDKNICEQAIQGFGRITRTNLYPSIDWQLYGSDHQLEYDLVLHPGAHAEDILLRVHGAVARLDAGGSLHAGDILHWRPQAYQRIGARKIPVEVRLVEQGEAAFGFALGAHRDDLDLVIDPVIQPIAVAGGSGEDTIIGSATSSGCAYRYGITRSAEWSNQAGPGYTAFVQASISGRGITTTFWGGDGDTQVGGATADLNNCRLYLVGWTSARNAVTKSAPYDGLTAQSYAGGASDGFFLELAYGSLSYASYVGGAGADRVYDVRAKGSSGAIGPFVLVGETDDPAWPGAAVQKFGPGGKSDAFATIWGGSQAPLFVFGGSGNDRAMRLRPADSGYYAIGGETDSPDFPSIGGTQSASGKDLWIGRISTDLARIPALRLFGGSGDEQFGGMAAIAGRGLYLAGVTNSTDLTATNNSQGGPTDAFVAAFDPLTAAPASATYIGGSGRDEVAALETDGYKLMLGGSTDSTDLALPGLGAGQNGSGGLDNLFVLCDVFGSPVRGMRFGGSGDDRVLGVESTRFGQAYLSGSSASREWLQGLDPFAQGLGGQDGFVVSMAFADLRAGAATGDLYLGRDLQTSVAVTAVSENDMDGTVTVRSTDPSKLLVSADSSFPGTGLILMAAANTGSYPRSFVLQALADSGAVDVVVEGRAVSPSGAIYPRQVLRVQLAPTALFASSRKEVTAQLNAPTEVDFFQAAVLPDGSAGPAQALRLGLMDARGVTTSDPAGLPVVPDSYWEAGPGQYRMLVQPVSAGTYTVTPTSARFPAAPNQGITVHAVATQAASVFSGQNFVLVKDSAAYYYLNPRAGDKLTFTPSDPSRLVVGTDASASSASVTIAASASSHQNLWMAALGATGTVQLSVTGTYQGQPIAEATQIALAGYQAALTGVPSTLGTGASAFPSVTRTPLLDNAPQGWIPLSTGLRPALFQSVQLQSSNSAVLQSTQSQTLLYYGITGGQPGTATLSFGPGAPVEFAGLSATVQVVPASLDFGTSLIRVPVGTQVGIFPSTVPYLHAQSSLSAVRLRLSAGAPVSIQSISGSGTDVVVDFSRQYLANLTATQTAQAGQQASLYVSAPGIAEFAIPIHITAPIFVPDYSEVRLGGTNQFNNGLLFHLAAYDDGQVFELHLATQVLQKYTARAIADPAGICTVPDSVDLSSSFTVPLQCAATGFTTVSLQPGPGIPAAQAQLGVRVTWQAAPPTPLPLAGVFLLGNGLQGELSMFGVSGPPFTGTLTSSDPDRVRLSVDSHAPGSASVKVPADGSVRSVFVQGYGSDGTAAIQAQSTDGRTGSVLVYLLPSTMAVRPAQGSFATDQSAALSLNQPFSSADFSLEVRPHLVDPLTKKLLWSSLLTVRGGTDPSFVRAQTSDSTIVQPVAPDGILNETDSVVKLKFHANRTGDVLLSASQPDGFIAVPDSALQTHVFERALTFAWPAVLSADLQLVESIQGAGDGQISGPATLTSMDPQKLLLSKSDSVVGQASITVSPYQGLYLQALSGVVPGDKVSVKLEAAGYQASQADVTFAAAELQATNPGKLSLDPLSQAYVPLVYGPINSLGRVSFNGSVRPGVTLPLHVTSSDPAILAIPQPDPPLNTNFQIPLRPLAPGQVQILVEAPPQITNRVGTVDAVVAPYRFLSAGGNTVYRYLINKTAVTNPRAQVTSVSISSTGTMPIRMGTTSSGPGAPSSGSLSLSLNPNETRSFYVEPAGPGFAGELRFSATDFTDAITSVPVSDPQIRFSPYGTLNLTLKAGPGTLSVILSGNSQDELPLGTAYGPLSIQLQSSNSQVVTVPSAPIVFNPGDSRKDVILQPAGAGDAVVSVIVPAAFSGSSNTRQDILVSVR